MKFIEAMKIKKRMCEYYSTGCINCPLTIGGNGTKEHCYDFMMAYPERAEEILTKWAEEKPMNNWISVKEDKKPRHLQECLIAFVYGDDDSDRHFYGVERYYAFDGNGLVDRPHFGNEGVEGMRVTHWIPIPKLPKGEPANDKL